MQFSCDKCKSRNLWFVHGPHIIWWVYLDCGDVVKSKCLIIPDFPEQLKKYNNSRSRDRAGIRDNKTDVE